MEGIFYGCVEFYRKNLGQNMMQNQTVTEKTLR